MTSKSITESKLGTAPRLGSDAEISSVTKVLHIGKYYPPFYGGIETFMQDLMEASNLSGEVECAAVVHHHEAFQPYAKESVNGVDIYRVPIVAKALFAPVSPRFGFYLQQAVDEFKPDVIHIHLPNTAALYCLFNKTCKQIPWVVHWHSDVLGDNSPWWLQLLYPVYHFLLERSTVNKSDAVIATSPPYAKISPVLKALPTEKLNIVPLGIRADKFTQTELSSPSGEHEKEPSKIQLLMIGRLTFYKGHHLLLKALGSLSNELLQQLHLTIIGKGEEESALAELANQLNLQDTVTFLGGVSMQILGSELRAADLLCLPSIERTEAFGVVLMEAASVGVPALVSDVEGSGMSWVVRHNETGVVVKSNDVQSIQLALQNIVRDKTVLQHWGEQSAAQFAQRFDIKEVARSVSRIYQNILVR